MGLIVQTKTVPENAGSAPGAGVRIVTQARRALMGVRGDKEAEKIGETKGFKNRAIGGKNRSKLGGTKRGLRRLGPPGGNSSLRLVENKKNKEEECPGTVFSGAATPHRECRHSADGVHSTHQTRKKGDVLLV